MSSAAKQQVEFYFSDSNFIKDKFLLSCAASNPEGWIPLATINSFNRMKAHGLSDAELADILADSDTVQVSEDKLSVRRIHPLPEKDTSKERSIRVKPLPSGSTIESVTEMFSKFGKVLAARLRKNFISNENDVAIVEFSTEEEAKKCLENSSELGFEARFEAFPDYLERKKQKYADRKANRLAEKQKAKEGKKALVEKDQDDGDLEYVSGCVLKMTNLPETCTREILADLVSPHGKVGYIDYSKGKTEALIRFSNVEVENVAQKVMEKLMEDAVKIGENLVDFSVLEGDEEALFYIQARERKAEFRKSRKGGKGDSKRYRR
ncbi:hypothetical protein P9112_005480 [Eukaryota sp. TZLM1-RC]